MTLLSLVCLRWILPLLVQMYFQPNLFQYSMFSHSWFQVATQFTNWDQSASPWGLTNISKHIQPHQVSKLHQRPFTKITLNYDLFTLSFYKVLVLFGCQTKFSTKRFKENFLPNGWKILPNKIFYQTVEGEVNDGKSMRVATVYLPHPVIIYTRI